MNFIQELITKMTNVLFADADTGELIPSDFSTFPHIEDPTTLDKLDVSAENTAIGFEFLLPPLGVNE